MGAVDILVEVEGLSLASSVGGILSNISMNLHSGDVVAVVGNSEPELAALMDTLYGVSGRTQGRMTFRGIALGRTGLAGTNTGFLFRDSLLFDNMTVGENIFQPALPRKWFGAAVNWEQISTLATETLEHLGIELDVDRLVSSLSAEERKLVSIAHAFCGNPDVVVMNCATESLGAQSVQRLYLNIDAFRGSRKGVLYLTQFWEEAIKVADRIYVLAEGTMSPVFLANEVRRNPQELLSALGHYNGRRSRSELGAEKNEILDAILRAAEFITGEYELNDVLKLLSEQAVQFMKADGCNIHLIDDQTLSIIDRVAYQNKPGVAAVLKSEVVLRVSTQDGCFYSNRHERDFDALFADIKNVRTVFCIPLLVRSRVIGVMEIYYEQFYAYSEEQFKYLATIGKHAVIAIEDTKLLGRSTLLQESHHRIKNNLQSVMNIIRLHKRAVRDPADGDWNIVLDDLIDKVRSIATVHDLLARDKHGRSVVNIREIVESILAYTKNLGPGFVCSETLENILIPYSKASSIGLIVNELLTNCVKHGVEGVGQLHVAISCKKEGEFIVILVTNESVSHSMPSVAERSGGLGLSIVDSIIRYDFGGTMSFLVSDKTTSVRVELPVPRVLLE